MTFLAYLENLFAVFQLLYHTIITVRMHLIELTLFQIRRAPFLVEGEWIGSESLLLLKFELGIKLFVDLSHFVDTELLFWADQLLGEIFV